MKSEFHPDVSNSVKLIHTGRKMGVRAGWF